MLNVSAEMNLREECEWLNFERKSLNFNAENMITTNMLFGVWFTEKMPKLMTSWLAEQKFKVYAYQHNVGIWTQPPQL